MSTIMETIEIARRPEDVFAYVTNPTHLAEWQESVVSVRTEEATPPHVGSKAVVTRRIGRREFTSTAQLDELNPPRSWSAHVIDGPIRARVKGTIEPLDNGERSRVTISLDFETHGIGKVLAPLVVRPQARKEVPRDEQHLKEILERGA